MLSVQQQNKQKNSLFRSQSTSLIYQHWSELHLIFTITQEQRGWVEINADNKKVFIVLIPRPYQSMVYA